MPKYGTKIISQFHLLNVIIRFLSGWRQTNMAKNSGRSLCSLINWIDVKTRRIWEHNISLTDQKSVRMMIVLFATTSHTHIANDDKHMGDDAKSNWRKIWNTILPKLARFEQCGIRGNLQKILWCLPTLINRWIFVLEWKIKVLFIRGRLSFVLDFVRWMHIVVILESRCMGNLPFKPKMFYCNFPL